MAAISPQAECVSAASTIPAPSSTALATSSVVAVGRRSTWRARQSMAKLVKPRMNGTTATTRTIVTTSGAFSHVAIGLAISTSVRLITAPRTTRNVQAACHSRGRSSAESIRASFNPGWLAISSAPTTPDTRKKDPTFIGPSRRATAMPLATDSSWIAPREPNMNAADRHTEPGATSVARVSVRCSPSAVTTARRRRRRAHPSAVVR